MVTTMPIRRMIIDIPNLLWRVYAMNKDKIQSSLANAQDAGNTNEQDEQQRNLGFCMHVALSSVLKYYKKYKPNQLAVVFEGRNNWRKEYSKSSVSLSKVIYKGNRVKDPAVSHLYGMIDNFRELVTKHTSIVTLQNDYLEGDDLIGGYVQRFAALGDEVYIVSGDRDFMQLYKLPNVQLINPDTGKDRLMEAKFKDFDPEYFLFEKCIRGDGGDNVPSAYPRVRETKIRAAFADEYARTQLMNATWKIVDPDEPDNQEKWIINRVGDLYEENKLLVDLFNQPPEVRSLIDEVLDEQLNNHGNWNMFYFLRWCGQYSLNQVADNVASYAEMFATTEKSKNNIATKQLAQPIAAQETIDADELLAKISSKKTVERTIITNSDIKNNLLEF